MWHASADPTRLVFYPHYGAHPAGRRSRFVFVSVAMSRPLYRIYRGVYVSSISDQLTLIVSSSSMLIIFSRVSLSNSLGAKVSYDGRRLGSS